MRELPAYPLPLASPHPYMLRHILPLILFLVGFELGAVADEPPLPQAIGDINDYAGILGPESRQQLQSLIDELKHQQVNIRLLITLLDPYSDPTLLVEKLWQKWELSEEQTVFVLLVKESDHWVFHWRFSQDLASQLEPSLVGKHRSSLQRLLDERRVGRAAVQAVESLRELLAKPQIQELNKSLEGAKVRRPFLGSPAFWYLSGGLAGVGGLVGLIWLALVWLCPQCGRRLRRSYWFRPSYARRARERRGDPVYYCPQCGYMRVRRGER